MKKVLSSVLILFGLSAWAQSYYSVQKLTTSLTNGENYNFGKTIASSASNPNHVAIADHNNPNSVHIFKKSNHLWSEIQQISTGSAFFGNSSYVYAADRTSMSSSTIVVGENGGGAGSFYEYEFNFSTEQYELIQTYSSSASDFGSVVSATQGALMTASNDRKVYIYRHNGTNWAIQDTIWEPSANHSFGKFITKTNTLIAVGDVLDDTEVTNGGAVYLYNWNYTSAEFVQKLTVPGIDTGAYLGSDILFTDDEHIYIAAHAGNNTGVERAGQVFEFIKSGGTWILNQELIPSTVISSDDLFGDEIEYVLGKLYISVTKYGNNRGTVLIFEKDENGQWQQTGILEPNGLGTGDYYGRNMSTNGRDLFVGAYFDDDLGMNSGAVYAFDICTTTGPTQQHFTCGNYPVNIEGQDYTPGSYPFTYTNANGCDSIVIHEVISNPFPTVEANISDNEICLGESITLTGSGTPNVIYNWGDGQNGQITDGQAYTPTGSETFYLIGTSADDCASTANVSVIVHNLPSVTAGISDNEVCSGDTISLSGSGAENYIWSDGQTDGQTFTVTASYTYHVTGTDINGCSNTDQTNVTVHEYPSQPTITFYGGQLLSSALNGNQWYFNTFLIPGETTQSITPQADGTYYVYVTENGCTSISEGYNYINTGVINGINISNLKVYPIPFKQHFVVESSDMESVKLFGSDGRLILHISEVQNGKATIETEQLSKGQYVLSVIGKSGVETVKIIK